LPASAYRVLCSHGLCWCPRRDKSPAPGQGPGRACVHSCRGHSLGCARDRLGRVASKTPRLRIAGETPATRGVYRRWAASRQKAATFADGRVLPVIRPMINQRLDEFEALPPRQQTARLDAIIDRMEQFRREDGARTFLPQRLALILQYLDPYTRARLRKYMSALAKRMLERGIAPSRIMHLK
jgi:hypothetical protein